MLQNLTLRTKLFGSFLFMTLLVAGGGGVGWQGVTKLSQHIKVLATNSVPSIDGLWKINEGQTQIESSERGLLILNESAQAKQSELARIQAAWQQIDQGFKQYEATSRTEEEDRAYQILQKDWKTWKQAHEEYIRKYRDLEEVLSQDPAGAKARPLLLALENYSKNMKPKFNAATNDLAKLIEINQQVAADAQELATLDANQATFWELLIIIGGSGTAISLGIILSNAIAKGTGHLIKEIANAIVSSSTEIATTVEQQERTITQQATSVNQTTATMDELGASSRQSAEQAEASAAGAQQALSLAEDGTQAVQETLEGMSTLKDKVGAIAEQILRLSEQTQQIGGISGLVGNLANQTNMLALNAAVEAARAGEHGKGFGVVASEIRKLADQSKKSAEKINALVGDIQSAINTTVMVTDEGTKNVNSSMKLTQSTAQTFTGVADAINNVFLNSQQISLSAKQQAVAIQQVVAAMNSINLGAKETASGITQVKTSTEQLKDAAHNLKAVV